MAQINELIELLDAPDERARRRAGDELLRVGRRAAPALQLALRHASARVRQSAAFLLGRAGLASAGDALAGALADEDPKVRKNIAVALGRVGGPPHAAQLAAALAREDVDWVRPSLVLALGALGGAQAHATLAGIRPQSADEHEALRKALDHTAPARPAAAWAAGGWRPAALLDTPPGLESVARDEAAAAGLPRPVRVGPGRLALDPGVAPDDLTGRLRCSYGPLLVAGAGPALQLEDPRRTAAQVAGLIGASEALRRWREWVVAEGAELRYRFAFGPRTRAETVRAALEGARRAGRPLGLVDSPSRYAVELVVESRAEGAELLVRPSFAPDARFGYRVRDVPAAIDPVIGAGLARLAFTTDQARVFDPTCGSATLLIERGMLGAARLHGIDRARDAVEAAHTNLRAAGLLGQAEISEGDAGEARRWPAYDELLANLPFGLRTRHTDTDIDGLYRALVGNLAQTLRPDGRAVLYTARPAALDHALGRQRGLSAHARLQVVAGGLTVTVLVIRTKQAR